MNKVLSFNEVSFAYEQTGPTILSQLSFSLDKGEFVSLLGPSGSGKSTIFRLITGLEKPSSGIITLYGSAEVERLGKVGYMPQQDLLLEWRTIMENVCLPLEIKKETHLDKQEVRRLLAEFGLAGHEEAYPHQLSGGMKQRASFLRAMLSGAELLLLDEPFSALDAVTRLSMQEWLLEQWEKTEKTVLFITHDVDEALLLSDRILLFADKPLHTFEEIRVPLGRPRVVDDLLTAEMLELKKRLLNQLRQHLTAEAR